MIPVSCQQTIGGPLVWCSMSQNILMNDTTGLLQMAKDMVGKLSYWKGAQKVLLFNINKHVQVCILHKQDE